MRVARPSRTLGSMTQRTGTSGSTPTSGERPSDDQRIADALVRLERAIDRRPGFGHSTGVMTTTLGPGLRCVSSEGDHCIVSDLPPALGGEGSAPTPSQLLRAALGSCLAMGYRLRAARSGIPVDAIVVDVETDSAIDGLLDERSPLPPGFMAIRARVSITSPATASRLDPLVDEADRRSPVLDTITRSNDVTVLHSIAPTTPTTHRGDR